MNHKLQKERYHILDALRGFALIGVIIVNAATINGPFWMDSSDFAFQTSSLDSLITKFSFIFLVERFYPLFTLIFGLSASLMIKKLYNNSLSVNEYFLKRTCLIAILGLLHVLLFFWGDILFVFASLGAILLVISKLHHKKIIFITFTLFSLVIVCHLLSYFLGLPEYNYNDLMITIYGSGSFLEITKQRLSDYYEWYYWGFFQTENTSYILDYGVYYIELLAFMTLGFTIGKYKEYFNKMNLYSYPLLKIIFYSFVGIFLIYCGKFLSIEWIKIFSPIEKILFVFLYSSGFCLLYSKMKTSLRKSFSSVGRMTLTWYLFFSVLMSFVLYGYGLGLYGKIGPSAVIGIGILYLLMIFSLSPIWLQKFREGPIETICKNIIYSNVQSRTEKN